MSSKGIVYLIPCPIAENTLDKALPIYNKSAIDTIDYFMVEEIRTARRFLSAYQIAKPIEQLYFFELNKDSSSENIQQFFAQIPSTANIGIISEAGCPGVADPGALAVKFAHQHHLKVVPLVGPSSILLALMGSGMNGQSFTFHGYLPIDKVARKTVLKKIEATAKTANATQIFMETPYRNNVLLEDIFTTCQPDTQLCIACDIMSDQELMVTKSVKQWQAQKPDLHKKPTMFLIG
jgi:16S rRNA (cytidine1402-2'-O)-methyltransferase